MNSIQREILRRLNPRPEVSGIALRKTLKERGFKLLDYRLPAAIMWLKDGNLIGRSRTKEHMMCRITPIGQSILWREKP